MRYSWAVVLWLLPCALFCGTHEDHVRAEATIRRALAALTPSVGTAFSFTRTTRRLAHLSRPWQTWNRTSVGTFAVADGASSFYQIDSITSGQKVYRSFTLFDDTTLAIVDYGESGPEASTSRDRDDFLYEVSDLTPIFLLRDALKNGERSFRRFVIGSVDTAVYERNDGTLVSIAIDTMSMEVRSVLFLSSDDMYGDVVTTVRFDGYESYGDRFRYPTIVTDSMLGFEASVASVAPSARPFDRERVTAMIPSTYRMSETSPERNADTTIVRTDYNSHIHLLDLPHTQDKVLVVEFKEFMLVAEAPLNTANGQMIIDKVHEIAPDKPIRYFVFGHYHPHYIGGLRAFVHNGTTILSTPLDTAYVGQLVSFRHTIAPDVLEREPRPLKLETFERERTISDGETEMRIIHIGSMSHHTEDYLIYYFPAWKLLFEDDLAWISSERPLAAASERQKGLYDAITLHGLDVETIVQGWPTRNGVRSVFGFDELKKSVEMIAPQRDGDR